MLTAWNIFFFSIFKKIWLKMWSVGGMEMSSIKGHIQDGWVLANGERLRPQGGRMDRRHPRVQHKQQTGTKTEPLRHDSSGHDSLFVSSSRTLRLITAPWQNWLYIECEYLLHWSLESFIVTGWAQGNDHWIVIVLKHTILKYCWSSHRINRSPAF